jgi:hypothetical protein
MMWSICIVQSLFALFFRVQLVFYSMIGGNVNMDEEEVMMNLTDYYCNKIFIIFYLFILSQL